VFRAGVVMRGTGMGVPCGFTAHNDSLRSRPGRETVSQQHAMVDK